jgi:hypothetical protein
MNRTILIHLLPLLAFTYFVVLPVSLAHIVEWIIHSPSSLGIYSAFRSASPITCAIFSWFRARMSDAFARAAEAVREAADRLKSLGLGQPRFF